MDSAPCCSASLHIPALSIHIPFSILVPTKTKGTSQEIVSQQLRMQILSRVPYVCRGNRSRKPRRFCRPKIVDSIESRCDPHSPRAPASVARAADRRRPERRGGVHEAGQVEEHPGARGRRRTHALGSLRRASASAAGNGGAGPGRERSSQKPSGDHEISRPTWASD